MTYKTSVQHLHAAISGRSSPTQTGPKLACPGMSAFSSYLQNSLAMLSMGRHAGVLQQSGRLGRFWGTRVGVDGCPRSTVLSSQILAQRQR